MSKRASVPPDWRSVIWAACDRKCAYCDEPLLKHGQWHMEHVIPIAHEGQHALDNLVSACIACNRTAGNRLFASVFAKRDEIRRNRGLSPLPASPERFQHLDHSPPNQTRAVYPVAQPKSALAGSDPAIGEGVKDEWPARKILYLGLHARAPEDDVAVLLAEAKRRGVLLGIILTESIAATATRLREEQAELDRAPRIGHLVAAT